MSAKSQKRLADLFLFLAGMIWIAFFATAKIIPVFMERWSEKKDLWRKMKGKRSKT